MIIGIGLDIVDIARVESLLERHDERALERLFSPEEIRYCTAQKKPAMHFAARFAAREACSKALGSGIGSQAGWRDMEVLRDAAGQPTLQLTGSAGQLAGTLGVGSIFLSLTHTDSHAAAVVVLEG